MSVIEMKTHLSLYIILTKVKIKTFLQDNHTKASVDEVFPDIINTSTLFLVANF